MKTVLFHGFEGPWLFGNRVFLHSSLGALQVVFGYTSIACKSCRTWLYDVPCVAWPSFQSALVALDQELWKAKKLECQCPRHFRMAKHLMSFVYFLATQNSDLSNLILGPVQMRTRLLTKLKITGRDARLNQARLVRIAIGSLQAKISCPTTRL